MFVSGGLGVGVQVSGHCRVIWFVLLRIAVSAFVCVIDCLWVCICWWFFLGLGLVLRLLFLVWLLMDSLLACFEFWFVVGFAGVAFGLSAIGGLLLDC